MNRRAFLQSVIIGTLAAPLVMRPNQPRDWKVYTKGGHYAGTLRAHPGVVKWPPYIPKFNEGTWVYRGGGWVRTE